MAEQFTNITVRNSTKVHQFLERAVVGTQLVFSQYRLEQLILRRQRTRFLKQVDPEGRPWASLSESTLRSGGVETRKLYRSGDLFKSIKIVRSHMTNITVQSNTGGGFRIGSRGVKYAPILNSGGYTHKGSRIPARRFLGVGSSDVDAVDRFIQRSFLKAGIR